MGAPLEKKISRQTALFDLLQMVDFGTTLHILNTGGTEMNPLLRPIADKPLGLGAVKGGLIVGNHLLREDTEEWLKTLRVANLLQGLFVLNNAFQIGKKWQSAD
jgi:hypothetical protein